MLKGAWGCTPYPSWNRLSMFNQLEFKFGNVPAEKGYDHVSAGPEYPRGGQSEMDRDRKAS